MAERVHRYISGYRCDATGCTAEVSGELMGWFEGQTYYRLVASGQGWTFWSSRVLRSYCGNHGPKPGHRMHRIEVR